MLRPRPPAGRRGWRRHHALGVGDAGGAAPERVEAEGAHEEGGDGEEAGLKGGAGDGALGDAPVDEAGDEAEGAGVGLGQGGAGLRGDAGEEVGALDVLDEAGVHAVGGEAAPAHGDDVAQHGLEGALGVEGLQRLVGAGVPVGDETREEVVVGGEVAVDGALGVLGAAGDLLDGDASQSSRSMSATAASRRGLLAQLEFAELAGAGADRRASS